MSYGMASPATSSSAGSPPALAPAPPVLTPSVHISSTPASIAPSPGFSAPTIVTSKVWQIPPRPKPGRKAATDIPPTKRKAQNRAAQRAFRERRAARVGELEEQLEETREEQLKREQQAREKLAYLEAQVQRFGGELQAWRVRCDALERMLDYERQGKEAAVAELTYIRNGAKYTGTHAVPLPPRRPRGPSPALQTVVEQSSRQNNEEADPLGCGNCTTNGACACAEQVISMAPSGCGKCTAQSHCQCLEETLNGSSEPSMFAPDLKRPHSPSQGPSENKRHRSSVDTSEPLEIDFTSLFAARRPELQQPLREKPLQDEARMTLIRPSGESCGFCDDGTYCLCAEDAANALNMASDRDNENRLAPLLNEVTPPPSDSDVTLSDSIPPKLQPLHPSNMHREVAPAQIPTSNPCANGPGTCQQCQTDPKSGLFCRSLAALRASSSTAASASNPPDGCCGGSSSGGGCCKGLQSSAATELPPPSLSVADTYKTLSTHNNFDQASDELNTWLGRLSKVPRQHAGRSLAPMEVEAASVMGVLKLFDRRFGRD